MKISNRRWMWFFALLGALTVTGIVLEIWSNLEQQLRPKEVADAQALWQEKRPANYNLSFTAARTESHSTRYSADIDGETIRVMRDGQQIEPELYLLYPAVAILLDPVARDDGGHAGTPVELEYSTRDERPVIIGVQVRNGRVTSATWRHASNKQSNDTYVGDRQIASVLYPSCAMTAMLRGIARLVELDRLPGSPRAFVVGTFDPSDGHVRHFVHSVGSRNERVEITVTKFDRVAE